MGGGSLTKESVAIIRPPSAFRLVLIPTLSDTYIYIYMYQHTMLTQDERKQEYAMALTEPLDEINELIELAVDKPPSGRGVFFALQG